MSFKNSSSNCQKLIFIAAIFLANLICGKALFAQQIEAKIEIRDSATVNPRARVSGKILNAGNALLVRDFSFLQNYADVSDLGRRIENLNLTGESGEKLEIKQLAPGEFQAKQNWISFDYDVKIAPHAYSTSAAHVSWVANDTGLLMLNDLLPQWQSAQPISAKLKLELPAGWKISTTERANNSGDFDVKNIEKAIFLIGKNWRGTSAALENVELNLAIAGNDWQFSDEEALEMAKSILEEYRRIFGETPVPKQRIFLLPFPKGTTQPDRWRAETRGSTVTIISGAIPLKSQALQRLHEQLRHEIFHLWIPNALNLTGNYDWFYEGFTVYQSLRTGVELNQIRFEDYLKTLGNAFDLAQNQNVSLLEISSRRWTGAGSVSNSVYGKGMVTAFLCDLALVRESKGKRSLADVFSKIYQKHKFPNAPQEANSAILEILKDFPELQPIVRNYIEGKAAIIWENELADFGIENVKENSETKLRALPKLSGRQKDLLDKLGYNQWRKLAPKTK